MQKVTAIITCFNEEQHIEAVLKSVQWCDEIIVVDSFSTDSTLEKAALFNTRILHHEYENPAKQKNWVIPQAANEWILLLDADERVTDELRYEIEKVLAQDEIHFNAFWIYRRNHFMGKEIKFSGWQRDKVIRLFYRDVCRYKDVEVHEEIETTGKVGKLKNKLLHYTYTDLEQYLVKWNRYSSMSAVDYSKKTTKPNAFHFVIKPAFRFFKHYIIDLGFLDGYPGFIISKLAAEGVFFRYMKLYELMRKKKK
ncbi:MAG: glycosyltransferase family 2 protein [Chitinophagales bacterium]|nr:glycosyltransferase family 2 protein [Bacteroidota bacterium]MBK8486584.1 glycosyltransferase family 2 protein [Bacteroidota bacterium]MBK8683365.1 glycosyltransferase family 2 protein [Bacteroidota bacterium]